MAGRRGRARALIFGLALAASGTALHAEPADVAPPNDGAFAIERRLAVVTPESEPEPNSEEQPDPKAEGTARAQRCYAKLGYYKGEITGKANPETWTAHWFFKNDHGLKKYGDFLSKPVQKKIKELCKDIEPRPEPVEAKPAPVPEAEPAMEETQDASEDADTGTVTAALGPTEPTVEEEPPLPPTRLDIDCLPADLVAVLRKAHGEGVRARECRAGCLPSPRGLSQSQLDDLHKDYGVVWCRSCVQIEGHLSLEDIRRVEEEGKIELCTVPPRQLPRPGTASGNAVKSFSRVRELYRALRPAEEDSSAIAVIIGNAAYENLPVTDTARGDAGAMYFFLTEHMGFRQDRIIDLRNARRADFERVFGPVPGSDGELARLVRAQPNAKVFVYYSGHGATNSSHSDTYLLPVDAEPYREERGGYPLSTLYDNLAALKAQSVLVVLESDYGRDHGGYVLPPNLPETTRSVLPAQPNSKVTILSATDQGQRALIDTRYDLGLFTRYVIEGLAGRGDLYPVGNGDGVVDSAELYVYAAAMSRLAARKTFGLLQEPVYSSTATPVLSGSGVAAAKPN